ncbi:rRNA-binding ribosome biosynthesis protein rpf2 [Bachmanniomyces sp. S44760]|nr:rRNA-binding ribosome biosynthesis protein rpf2 [Bachmanniomyces sp. S44760]
MLRDAKPKNARAARLLKKKDPLQHENPKTTLFLRSTTSSSLINALLTDLNSLKQPHSIRFTKKNSIHPFEDPSSLEFFSQRNDASLLCFGSHSKKRPHCLTFVRCFGGKILDILEATVVSDTARTLGQFGGGKCRIGAKPLLSFSGTQFENLEGDQRGKFAVAKSIFLDFFRGGETKEVDVEGLQYMINFSAGEVDGVDCTRTEMVYMRCWKLVTKRSGQKLPRVELEEMGPRIDFRLGRVTEANESMLKEALRRSESTEAKVKKNVKTDIVGDKMGRIHLGRQDLAELQTRKMKGLKSGRNLEARVDERGDIEGESDLGDMEIVSENEVEDDDIIAAGDYDDSDGSDAGDDSEHAGGVPVKKRRLE